MVEVKSQQELLQLLEKKPAIRKLDIPSFYSTGVGITIVPTDCTLTFSRPVPIMIDTPDGQPVSANAVEPILLVSMSPQSAKDLYVIMGEFLGKYEADWGKLETEFTRSKTPKK